MSGAVGSTLGGSAGLIFFVMYVIFGPGMILFQLVALVRYYWLDKTNGSEPDALIQWPTDPSAMKSLLGVGTVITIAPVVYALLIK